MDYSLGRFLLPFTVLGVLCVSSVYGLFLDHSLQCSNKVQFTLRALPNTQLKQACYFVTLTHPSLVNRIALNIERCHGFHKDTPTHMSLSFIGASDVTKTPRNYSTHLLGTLDANMIEVAYNLSDPIYAESMVVIVTEQLDCATVQLQGCSPAGMCSNGFCQNGGKCIGKDKCACADGFLGERCETTVNDLTVSDLTFESLHNQTLSTTSGLFKVVGDVVLLQSLPGNMTQSPSTGYLSFQHSGGYCEAAPHNSTGKRDHGRLLCAVFCNLNHHGFSHTSTFHLGHNHNHNHVIHLFNSHYDWKIINVGASLTYHKHKLVLVVNLPFYRHKLTVNWHPSHSIPHVVTTTFCPQFGLSMFINGQHMGSQSLPMYTHSGGSFGGLRLCFGSCNYGHNHHRAPLANYFLSNIRSVAGCAAQLAQNGIGGLIGLSNRNTHTTTTSTASTTTSITTTTSTTTTMSTTTTSNPTLLFTATANTHNAPTPLMCYSCTRMAIDGACATPKLCAANEVCALFHDQSGYTHRCLDGKTCSKAKAILSKSCWECCTSSLCNHRCSSTVPCNDSSQCAVLQSTGFNVCTDPQVSTTDCKATCGHCPSTG